MMYVQKIYDIVAYTYRADQYCATCIEEIALVEIDKRDARRQFEGLQSSTEGLLNHWADLLGIDRENESSYDSGVFPKVVYRSMVEQDERCGQCGEVL